MSDIGIGKLVTGTQGNDAVHIAVAPMTATAELTPGQHIGLVDMRRAGPSEHPVGIVDPFLTGKVEAGQRFFMFMYPGSITSLRHEWIHPAFVGASFSPESASHKWIEEFAARLNYTVKRLMDAAGLYDESEEYELDNTEAYKDIPSPAWEEFWKHYEVVTGKKPKDPKASFFTCSC